MATAVLEQLQYRSVTYHIAKSRQRTAPRDGDGDGDGDGGRGDGDGDGDGDGEDEVKKYGNAVALYLNVSLEH